VISFFIFNLFFEIDSKDSSLVLGLQYFFSSFTKFFPELIFDLLWAFFFIDDAFDFKNFLIFLFPINN
jgi:hypothetical protein